jgi:hypothetical protein
MTGTPLPRRDARVWEFHHEDGRIITSSTSRSRSSSAAPRTGTARCRSRCSAPPSPASTRWHGIGRHRADRTQLLRELSTLRSQRRDNAALALAKVFAVSDGAVDLNDLQFFPGAVIPVHGEPRDFLYPIPTGDIPNSSYNEEDRINQDIDRGTGISDTVTGADASQGAAATATGVQLVQAAANVRIQRQTRRLEVELVTREAGRRSA